MTTSALHYVRMRLITMVVMLVATMTVSHAQTEHSVNTAGTDALAITDAADTLTRQALDASVTADAHAWNVPIGIALPYGIGGYGLGGLSPLSAAIDGTAWRLHEGFNAQFGLSLSAGLGKHAMKGVGFGQNAAFAYVAPITPKLTVAAGIFASNLDWGSWRRTDVGIGGMMAYNVNERVNLYVYGSKSFVPRANDFRFRHDPFPLFLDQPRDRIGAAAEFKVGKNAMIGVSVEHRSY